MLFGPSKENNKTFSLLSERAFIFIIRVVHNSFIVEIKLAYKLKEQYSR